MFTTLTNDPTVRALLYLENAPDHWHPCGSRFFGDAEAASDFDFFSDYFLELEEALKQNGFSRLDQKYCDTNTVCVYARGHVHAILVRSVARRLAAQESFKDKPKADRKLTSAWDKVYAAQEVI